MVDFRKVSDRKVLSPRLILHLEIELSDSLLSVEDADASIHYMINGSRSRGWSAFIMDLIRETRSSLWEVRSRLEVTE